MGCVEWANKHTLGGGSEIGAIHGSELAIMLK